MSGLDAYLKPVRVLLDLDPPRTFDAFTLLYTKMEVQMRKLVAFVLRTDPHSLHWSHVKRHIASQDRDPDHWRSDFDRYSTSETPSFQRIIGRHKHPEADPATQRSIGRNALDRLRNLKAVRNDVIHGVAVSGETHARINTSPTPNTQLTEWITTVATAMDSTIGYDGIANLQHHDAVTRNYRFDAGAPREEVKAYLASVSQP